MDLDIYQLNEVSTDYYYLTLVPTLLDREVEPQLQGIVEEQPGFVVNCTCAIFPGPGPPGPGYLTGDESAGTRGLTPSEVSWPNFFGCKNPRWYFWVELVVIFIAGLTTVK